MVIEKKHLNKSDHKEEYIFSIMIPSWNNLTYLQLCINSIRKNSYYPHQLIVHINEGSDGTLEWIQSQPDISYSYSPVNIGVCYALNSCRTLAVTDYLLYINDDMYVCPNWDKPLLDEIKKIGHKYFFLSATAIEIKAQSSCSIQKNFGTSIDQFQEETLIKEFATIPFHDWQGATWPPNVVHKDIWDLVGGYSVEFSPGMYSDPDFSMKLWQVGIRLFKGLEKSRVYHFGSISVKRVKRNKGYYTFIAKWGMTSGTLSKYYLRRGDQFDGPLSEQQIPKHIHLKNYFKRFWNAVLQNG
jgi:glycosyltransferase involved in cell wall biosynthesis